MDVADVRFVHRHPNLEAYFWFYGVNRGSGDEDPLAYIPQDSNLVIGLDLATLLNDPILGPQIKQNMVKGANVGDDFIDRIKKETGLEAHELFARTTAAGKWDLSQGNQPGMKQGDTPYNFTIVLQTSKPFDQKKMAKA